MAPRFGVAWDVRGDGKTVVRAGFGVLEGGTSMAGLNTSSSRLGRISPAIGVNNSGTDISLHTPALYIDHLLDLVLPWHVELEPDWRARFPTAGTRRLWSEPLILALPAPRLPARLLPAVTGAMNPNLHQPYAAEWNPDIQRAITNKLTLDVAYVGDHGYDMKLWST